MAGKAILELQSLFFEYTRSPEWNGQWCLSILGDHPEVWTPWDAAMLPIREAINWFCGLLGQPPRFHGVERISDIESLQAAGEAIQRSCSESNQESPCSDCEENSSEHEDAAADSVPYPQRVESAEDSAGDGAQASADQEEADSIASLHKVGGDSGSPSLLGEREIDGASGEPESLVTDSVAAGAVEQERSTTSARSGGDPFNSLKLEIDDRAFLESACQLGALKGQYATSNKIYGQIPGKKGVDCPRSLRKRLVDQGLLQSENGRGVSLTDFGVDFLRVIRGTD